MNITEKDYARKLLETRRLGVSVGWVLRANVRRYLILLLGQAAIVGAASLGRTVWTTNAAFFFGGCVFAVFLRDSAWARASKRTWPFNERVINWSLVEEIAAGEPRRPGDHP